MYEQHNFRGRAALDNADELCQGKDENQVAAVACQRHLHEGSERFPPADIEMADAIVVKTSSLFKRAVK